MIINTADSRYLAIFLQKIKLITTLTNKVFLKTLSRNDTETPYVNSILHKKDNECLMIDRFTICLLVINIVLCGVALVAAAATVVAVIVTLN